MVNWKKYYMKFVGSAALNAGIFVAYRLYVHYRKHKLSYLSKSQFKPFDTYPYKILDFTEHQDKFSLITFYNIDDDLGPLKIAFFKYKDVFCSMHKYVKNKPEHYTIFIDVKGCSGNNKTFEQVGVGFIKAIGFEDVPVIWTNSELSSVLDDFNK